MNVVLIVQEQRGSDVNVLNVKTTTDLLRGVLETTVKSHEVGEWLADLCSPALRPKAHSGCRPEAAGGLGVKGPDRRGDGMEHGWHYAVLSRPGLCVHEKQRSKLLNTGTFRAPNLGFLVSVQNTGVPNTLLPGKCVQVIHSPNPRLALTPTTIPPSSHNRLEKDQPSARPRDDVLMSDERESGRVQENQLGFVLWINASEQYRKQKPLTIRTRISQYEHMVLVGLANVNHPPMESPSADDLAQSTGQSLPRPMRSPGSRPDPDQPHISCDRCIPQHPTTPECIRGN
ncbi:unnamed protein product [Arctogadus glacialis]